MKINLGPVFAGQVQYADVLSDIQPADLYTMTDELLDTIESNLVPATDSAVLFVPRDPAASDQSGQGWTIGHIVVHLTATLEEMAAASAMLARGVEFEGRLRYETPWEEIQTLQMLRERLQESRRMCHSFLDAWPNSPHLSVTRTLIPALGPINAIGCYVLGIAHGQGHLDQIRDVLEQHSSAVNS